MNKESLGPFGPDKIQSFLPHRYPFLFVDRIESVTPGRDKSGNVTQLGTVVVGIKAATINEPYFMGHFPGNPITPGVILVETMAQVSSFGVWPWVRDESEDVRDFELRLVGVDRVRFRKPVVPGDILRVTAELTKYRNPLWGFKCNIRSGLDDSVFVEGDVLASVVIHPVKKG